MKYTTFVYEMIPITKGFVTFNKYARNFNFHNETKTALTLSQATLHIQGVTGGTDQTSGECSLGQTIPI